MRPQVFDFFDSTWIINLRARTDRRRDMDAQLAKVGLNADSDQRLAYFAAISVDNAGPFLNSGTHGCYLSHRAVIEQAASAGGSVLIIEDDCDFHDGVMGYRVPPDTDVFYGGYNASDPADLEGSDIVGAHFMGFSALAVQLLAGYLDRLVEPDFPPDSKAAAQSDYNPAIRPPVDGAYVWFRRAHPKLNTVFAMLTEQRSSRTDIGDKRLFDWLPGVRDVAEAARRLKRQLT